MTIVYVHGTGVRHESFQATVSVIAAAVAARWPSIRLSPCYWGASGAALHAGGASIPQYPSTRALGPAPIPLGSDWAILYDDPLFELRVLASEQSSGSYVPGRRAGLSSMLVALSGLEERPDIVNLLARYGFVEALATAKQQVVDAAEFQEISDSAEAATPEIILAVARAIGAQLIANTAVIGVCLTGAERDHLVGAIQVELGADYRAIGGWIKSSFVFLSARLITSQGQRKRGAISDAACPAAGDVLLYQAHGGDIRRAIGDAIRVCADDVVLLAHSLGGIACVDLLVEEHYPQVKTLVTVGSQAPLLYEIGALGSLPYGEPLPDRFPPWLNIYDLADFLSYVGAALFPGRVRDARVDNGQPFPPAHSAYWTNTKVWEEIGAVLPS